jgi:hypothetical protein
VDFSGAVAARAAFGDSDRGGAEDGGGTGFCAGAVDFAVRCGPSPGRAACALEAGCDPDDCDFGGCELAVVGPGACDAPGDCDFGACEVAVVGPAACGVSNASEVVVIAAADDSLCAFDASVVAFCAPPDCTVGCSGPLGCGVAGPLLSAEPERECDSSPRLIVYDLNGGSSDEVGAAPAGIGADGPFGPDNSSGTNNTIRTTRMIAPVSRSFT